MGFWDKLEKWAEKVEKSANDFEKKANDFLDKNFPEEETTRPTYTSQKLLSLTKSKARKIAGDRLLAGLKSLDGKTTKMDLSRLSEADGVYDGLDIATATIERTTSNYQNLSDVQYRINLKGLVTGIDAYGQSSVYGKYEIKLIADEYAEYIIEAVKVTRRW